MTEYHEGSSSQVLPWCQLVGYIILIIDIVMMFLALVVLQEVFQIKSGSILRPSALVGS